MKNLILQHWTGELDDLATLSSANIQKYARKVDADYRLLRGNVFHSNLTSQCQKLYMLDKEFDDYDIVVMLDMDVFTRKGMEENIFEVEGVGMSTELQETIFKSIYERFQRDSNFRKFTNPDYPYWAGSIYRLDRDLRQQLRKHINENEMLNINRRWANDELIMHRLATLAKIEKSKLPGGFKWSHCSYRDGIENAAMIHIRPKITPIGPKRPKIENYRDLVKRGLIEE